MFNRLIILLLLFIHFTPGYAQTQGAIERLHNQLSNAKDDTSRINLQIQLCILYRLGNSDSSLIYGQKAFESAKRVNYLYGQIRSLGIMSIVASQQGNLPNSLELGFKALQLAEENGLEKFAWPAIGGISDVYLVLKDYRKAISYLSRYPINIRTDFRDAAYAYFHLGDAYLGLNQLDSADFYLTKAIASFHRYDYEEPLVYQALGDLKIKLGKTANALLYYQTSLQVALTKNEPRTSAQAYNILAKYYMNLNKADSAIWYAQKGLAVSVEIAQKKSIMDAATVLSELYEVKDIKESLRYLKITVTYKDSLFGAGNMQAVETLVANEEDRQKEIVAAKAALINQRAAFKNQLKIYALGVVVGISLLIAFFQFRNSRRDKKARLTLQQKNETIEKTLNHLKSTQAQLIQSEKMASLGELTAGIAHEIQNPLNFVKNFSEVNTELSDELLIAAKAGSLNDVQSLAKNIKTNQEKINEHSQRADSIVKSMLLHSRISSGQKELTEINALCDEYLRLAFHGFRAKEKNFNAELKTNFDLSIGKIQVIPQDLGRVLLNLYNNAFYAVDQKAKTMSNGYFPVILVSTMKKDGMVEIRIEDNGPGIPDRIKEKIFQPFFTTKPTGQGTGLGLSLSYDIVKAHGGEIKVSSENGKGAEFTVILPTKS